MILRKGWPDPENLRPAQIWSKGSNAKSCTWSSQVIYSTRIIVGMTNFRILSAWNASIAILNYNTDHEHQYAMSTVNITSTGNLGWNWRCVCRFIAVCALTYQLTPTSTDHGLYTIAFQTYETDGIIPQDKTLTASDFSSR